MPFTPELEQEIQTLRRLGYGDRKIARLVDIPYGRVRRHREKGQRARDDGYNVTVIVPDIHWPFEDRAAEACVMEAVSGLQPDEVLQLGDAFDMFSVARFLRGEIPSARHYLRSEIDFGRARLREWRSLAPDATYTALMGNHEARLSSYLESNALELYDLGGDELSPDRLLGYDAAGWELVGQYPDGVWRGDLHVYHGSRTTKYAAMNTLESRWHSVAFGHTHRVSLASKTDGHGQVFVAAELGHLSGEKVPGRPPGANWQHGFGVLYWIPDGRFHLDVVHVIDGACVVSGRRFGRPHN